ncbi:primary-amine oxidase [Cladophialophora yegresii CBS 114405]|uniref:Amine oxidase n=1 Tax=Cladophialophora yegresii CBS 114405 TaxID=1182544 RepID=W9VJL6_9EURO|nr:primary-amine oxidase [Cladophialophora yegresii CBS 114405]EXJ55847.1 primary-amine oxidase [Cladophialophora yegresii CBS 114405]
MAISPPHPLDPLTPQEISATAQHVRKAFPDSEAYFRVITLAEPPKEEMMVFLDAEHEGQPVGKRPARLATVQVFFGAKRDSEHFYELKVNVDSGEIVHKEQLAGRHPHVDGNDMVKTETACLNDPRVQAAIKDMQLPDGAVVKIEPWTYATDGMNDMSQKITMCYFYMRLLDHPDANHYAYPLDLCVEMSGSAEVLKIYYLPASASGGPTTNATPYDRSKIFGAEIEYHPDVAPPRRTTTKPYHVSQPEGPSFATRGNLVQWEKWHIRVGFNYREGLTLHDVRYDGHSLFYRLSLSEMFVPYGDPRTPYARKAAFDLGNDGAGCNANNLQLGCDCLGHIKYFDGWHVTSSGDAIKIPNAVCCHEVDDGILWKHTNFRTGNGVVVRSRVLVLQTIITVSNYEYIFAFHFGMDASLQYEVRATGIVSTVPIPVGGAVPFGTTVAPGVMAPYHQHLFCLRIDPAVGGWRNSLLVEESHPLPVDNAQPPHNTTTIPNPFRIGYTTRGDIVDRECGLALDHTVNRVFKIVNEAVLNPVTNTPIAYKLTPYYSQLLLADASSYHAKRSEFAAHPVWVTRYHDDELFASGKHTMQSLGGEGIASWIDGRKHGSSSPSASSVRNEDIVVWHTFGSTHNPRVEDWPVMPCEKMSVGLKPVNFFTRNPAMDVRPSCQAVNRSVLVDGEAGCHGNGGDGQVMENGVVVADAQNGHGSGALFE